MSNESVKIIVISAIFVVTFVALFLFVGKKEKQAHISAKKILKLKDEETVVLYMLGPNTAPEVKRAGFNRLAKAESFMRIASFAHFNDDTLFYAALDRISEDSELYSVLLAYSKNQDRYQDRDRHRVQAVLDKIKNQDIINEAAIKGSVYALEKVEDQDVLVRAAIVGSENALEKIKGDQGFSAVYTQTQDRYIKEKAFSRIHDEDLKARISEEYAESVWYKVYKYANEPEKLFNIISNIDDGYSRRRALDKISNPDTLVFFALNHYDSVITHDVIERIFDPNALYRIFEKVGGNDYQGEPIIKQLEDPSTLEKIAKGSFNLGLRIKAANRYLSISRTSETEKEAIIRYMTENARLIDMYDVLPESLHSKYGLRRKKLTYEGYDGYGPYDITEIEYYLNDVRLDQLEDEGPLYEQGVQLRKYY